MNTGGAGIGFFAARNCSAYNNTVVTASPQFHAPLFMATGEIWIDDNTTLRPPNFNIQAYNNIFVDQSGTGDEDFTVQIREGALTGTNLIDYNIYQKTGGTAKFDDGVSWSALIFSQWKSQMGFDANSSETDPGLNGQFHLESGSPVIDAGQNSPAIRDYDAQPRSGGPDIGADEYGNGNALLVPPPSGIIGTGTGEAVSVVTDLLPSIEVAVFPNPASDFVFVKMAAEHHASALKLTIASLGGKQMRTTNGLQISLENLPDGLYLLTIEHKDGQASMPVIVHR